MILDSKATLGTAQAVTVSAGTTDYYDAGSNRDIGLSSDLFLQVNVDESADAVGAATVQFGIQVDTDSAFGTPKQVALSGAIGKADLTAGREPIRIPLPPGTDERYIRGNFVVATGPLTAGKFTTKIVHGHDVNKSYPNAI